MYKNPFSFFFNYILYNRLFKYFISTNEDDHEYKICLYKNPQLINKTHNVVNELDDIINNYKSIFHEE